MSTTTCCSTGSWYGNQYTVTAQRSPEKVALIERLIQEKKVSLEEALILLKEDTYVYAPYPYNDPYPSIYWDDSSGTSTSTGNNTFTTT